MSIVKDFLLISIFLFLIIRNFILYKNLITERKYFINTLKHDLKVATIAQIRGIDLLRKNADNNEITQSIHDSCLFSLDLINTLIKTYKYKNKEQVLLYETINITELIKQLSYSISSDVEKKNIALKYKTNFINQVYADKEEFKKAILILLSTSLNNAKKNSKIEIEIKQNYKNISFSISYKGIPLKEEECNRMFYKKTRFAVMGLGAKMHLCKKIIDFHKGSIKVKTDRNMNYFIFTIPNTKENKTVQKQLFHKLQPYHF